MQKKNCIGTYLTISTEQLKIIYTKPTNQAVPLTIVEHTNHPRSAKPSGILTAEIVTEIAWELHLLLGSGKPTNHTKLQTMPLC